MKKPFFLLITLLGLFILGSCSSEDDVVTPERSIVNTWTLVSVEPPVIDLSCPNDPTITFDEDGTTSWTLYDEENDCESMTSTGTWSNTTGSEYTVTVPGYGDVTGTVTFTSDTGFYFETPVPGMPVDVRLTFAR